MRHNLRVAGCLVAACVLATGCSEEPEPVVEQNAQVVLLQAELDTLRVQNLQLEDEIRLRDEFLKEYTRLINQTLSDLERIAEREGAFRAIRVDLEAEESGQSSEGTRTIERRINENLDAIEEFIKEGKLRQQELTRFAHLQADEIDGLKGTVERLNALVEVREQTIAELRTEARTLLNRIKRLNTHNEQLVEENTELREAYFVVDTPDALEEKGIVDHRRGFLRLKRKTRIEDLDAANFEVADVATNEIPLGKGLRYRVLSDHRQNEALYSIEERGDDAVLAISDTDAFWKISRFLIVEVKR